MTGSFGEVHWLYGRCRIGSFARANGVERERQVPSCGFNPTILPSQPGKGNGLGVAAFRLRYE
jgi:hypothetical protein